VDGRNIVFVCVCEREREREGGMVRNTFNLFGMGDEDVWSPKRSGRLNPYENI
jgi:hypothetical protein